MKEVREGEGKREAGLPGYPNLETCPPHSCSPLPPSALSCLSQHFSPSYIKCKLPVYCLSCIKCISLVRTQAPYRQCSLPVLVMTLFRWDLDPCLVHSRCSTNTCRMNEIPMEDTTTTARSVFLKDKEEEEKERRGRRVEAEEGGERDREEGEVGRREPSAGTPSPHRYPVAGGAIPEWSVLRGMGLGALDKVPQGQQRSKSGSRLPVDFQELRGLGSQR